MKKRNIIIVAAIVLIAVIISVVIICNGRGEEKQEKPEKQTSESVDETKKEEVKVEDETTNNNEYENDTEDYSDIVTDVEAAFKAALDYIVLGEDIKAQEKVSNAILKNTEIIVDYANETICKVTVKYPDAALLLRKAEEGLKQEATEEEINDMMEEIAKAIEDKKAEMIEKTIETKVFEKDGIWNIEWTSELYDAVTGGLYSIE